MKGIGLHANRKIYRREQFESKNPGAWKARAAAQLKSIGSSVPDEILAEAKKYLSPSPHLPLSQLEEIKARSLPLVRVNDLAVECRVKSRLILDTAKAVGVQRRLSHSSSLGQNEADKVRSYLTVPAS